MLPRALLHWATTWVGAAAEYLHFEIHYQSLVDTIATKYKLTLNPTVLKTLRSSIGRHNTLVELAYSVYPHYLANRHRFVTTTTVLERRVWELHMRIPSTPYPPKKQYAKNLQAAIEDTCSGCFLDLAFVLMSRLVFPQAGEFESTRIPLDPQRRLTLVIERDLDLLVQLLTGDVKLNNFVELGEAQTKEKLTAREESHQNRARLSAALENRAALENGDLP